MLFRTKSISLLVAATALTQESAAFAPHARAAGACFLGGGRAVGPALAPEHARGNTQVARSTTSSDSETSSTSASAASVESTESHTSLSEPFAQARDSVVQALRSALETKSMEAPLIHFIDEYFGACDTAVQSGRVSLKVASPKRVASNVLKAIELGMLYGMGNDKYTFDVAHEALRADNSVMPDFDFYKFGCDFFRPAMDLERSIVLGQDNLKEALAKVAAGENVVFLANHQSEADPQVVSNLFETLGEDMGEAASKITYVAGHKVTTDPLAIPFSMGRNLLCIHSKKHISSDPELKPMKQRQNLAAMGSMLNLLRAGGALLWVAPSGGRDRRDLATGQVPIAPFDQKTVDMFRLMGVKSKVKTNFYSMAMVSYDLCPPPDVVEPGVGEQRNVRFTPIGIALSDEVANVGGVEARHLFCQKAHDACEEGYAQLLQTLEANNAIE